LYVAKKEMNVILMILKELKAILVHLYKQFENDHFTIVNYLSCLDLGNILIYLLLDDFQEYEEIQ
jgi:hypothetical protein